MPRGNNLKKNKHNENALTTRLMQISLTMDDHIYCGKLITASEAGIYLQEIATLKLKCLPTNVRALQVIEKLTRCMRSILTEENTEHDGNSFDNPLQMSSEFAGSTSPVYSLPDEDRTYEIGEQNDVEIVNTICISEDDETSKDQSYFIHTSHKQTNMKITSNNNSYMAILSPAQNNFFDPNHTLNDTEIIDITNTDTDETNDIGAVSKQQNVLIENVNSKMSIMAIQDENPCKMPVDDNDCSQSILDNYNNENSDKTAREKGSIFEKDSYYNIDAKAHVTKKVNKYFGHHTPVANKNNYFAQHTPVVAITSQTATNTPQKIINSQSNKAVFNLNCESVKQPEPVPLENNSKRVRTKKVNNRKDEKVSRKKNSKSSKGNSGQNCKNNYRKNAINSDKENVPRAVKMSKKHTKKKAHGIYNNNVENDLSWVENIRYVREISIDEYDPALSLIEDNFWDNFALPDKWDDLDFEY